ncbi:MAG: beta-CASP ribonuclease aCPSF1 [Candidatus Aenigmatarchaeota archaeon]
MVEIKTSELFEKIKQGLPADAQISDIRFEGCEVVLYTKSREFFTSNSDAIKGMVGSLKKRIILRPDPSICADPEEARKAVDELVPKEAGVKEVLFEPDFGIMTVEADKPGLVIGKGGELLREIRKRTCWLPHVKRSPAIPNEIIKTLRELIYKESSFRKEFLDKVGRSIHSGWKQTDWVRLTALGGFREVGRSAVLLQTPESSVLLDCGIKPGNNELPYLNIPEFDVKKLNAVVLTHAHMDHAGAIPMLYEYGCEAPLYCTVPTRDLMVLLCMDSLNLMNKEGRQALYSTKGIKEAVKRCITLEYDEVSDITPDMRLTLLNSGHILGSALAHIHVGDGLHNILYTSDIKFDRTALYEAASTNFARAETVITESTYGLSTDVLPRRDEAEGMLTEVVKRTLKRGGKVLIPSFAVERSQDLQVILEKNGIESTIYLDGMVWDATAIHTTYPEYMNRDLQKQILQQGKNPFLSPVFKRIGSQDERQKVLSSHEPCVIIATSGMLIGGPSVWWLRNLAEDKKNTVIFVGYQSEGSLGRRIQKGWKEVPMEQGGRNVAVPVNCEVATVEGLSGHSDRKQLVNYLTRLRQRPERIIVNHGEERKCIELARDLHKIMRVETLAPKLLETIRLK